MSNTPVTRVAPSPSESVLVTLARAAMATRTGEPAVWPTLDLSDAGQRIFGDYELLEEIGRGGMGVVYRAHQLSLDRDVAIKFIAAGIDDSLHVTRFLAEARSAARLVHPNIVPVHEVGSIDGLHYLSMPLMRGQSLADRLDKGPLTPDEAVSLLLKLCDAIHYAHRLGLLHLDLKPANILIDEHQQPLVADFGLARHMDGQGGVDAQEVSGTPQYMAPEQILIKQYRLTHATDLYALGALLYRVLTGVSPHGEGQPDDVIRRAAAGRVRPPRELNPAIPRDLDAICMKCLELQPADRYPGVATLADDLRRVRDGLPVSVRRIGIVERAQRWFKREPKLAFASSAAALALLIGAAATTWQWHEASAQRDAAVAQRNSADTARKVAEQQRDLAQGMAELGAWYYTQFELFNAGSQQTGQQTPEMKNKIISVRMLDWLGKRYPGDDHRQTAVLTAFAEAINRRDGSNDLMLPVVEVMGKTYREQMIAALLAGREPNRYILAARLAWNTERNMTERNDGHTPTLPTSPNSDGFASLLDKAITAQPDNPDVWEVAAIHCVTGGTRCHPEAASNLTRLAPGNAYNWLLRMMETEGDEARAALHEAAQRTTFDDGHLAGTARYLEAVDKAHVPAPKLLAGIIRVFSPHMTPELTIAEVETNRLPLVGWRPFQDRCDPSKHYFKEPTAYDDCKAVATVMSRSKSTLLTRRIAAIVVRRLAKGTPLEREMIDLHRRYLYVSETIDKLSPDQIKSYPTRRFRQDEETLGALEAWESELAYYGLPSHPPKDWQPKDPCSLELPENRDACHAAHPSPR